MSKSVYYFRRYRQSQDGATIPEWNGGTERTNGRTEQKKEYSCSRMNIWESEVASGLHYTQ